MKGKPILRPKIPLLLCIFFLCCSLLIPMPANAKTKRKHKTLKQVTLYEKESKKIPIRKRKGMKYTSSNKKVAVISKNGRLIKAKRKGNCTITIKTKKKIYKIPIKVKRKNTSLLTSYTSVSNSKFQYSLVHIKVKDPSQQIKHGIANDKIIGKRERASQFAKRKNAVLTVNASYFMCQSSDYYINSVGCSSLLPYGKGVYLHSGKLYQSDGYVMRKELDYNEITTGSELCLTRDGTLFSPEFGVTAQELLAKGVTDTISCGSEPILIKDGIAQKLTKEAGTQRYNRMAIGMKKPGEYYILAAGGLRDWSNTNRGLTQKEMQRIFIRYGCTFARCMDGGGSTTLYLNGRIKNELADDMERPVADFLYFIRK